MMSVRSLWKSAPCSGSMKKNRDYVSGGTVSDFDPSLFNLVGDISMFDIEVACALAGGVFSVDVQVLFCLVVLVEVRCVCVPLRGDEEVSPHHTVDDVADAN